MGRYLGPHAARFTAMCVLRAGEIGQQRQMLEQAKAGS